jgi:transposase-like protein
MKTLTTELVDSGEKRDTRGRRIARKEERLALIAAYEESGLTQRAFANREGVKYCTFTTWLSQHRRGAGGRPKATFAEVSLGEGGGRAPGMIEVVLPDGVIVRGADPETIAVLISKLRRC